MAVSSTSYENFLLSVDFSALDFSLGSLCSCGSFIKLFSLVTII
jgi:hypothetical protein